MKLLGLYIKKYNHLYENVRLQFDSAKEIDYINDCLIIKANPGKRENFYGEVFQSVTAIVGKNGSGKTSLLNLIGNSMKERVENATIENREITDQYIMVCELSSSEKNIYYVEQVGNFDFRNIGGYSEMMEREGNTKFHCFCIEADIDETKFKIIDCDEIRGKRIVYLLERNKLWENDLVHYDEMEGHFSLQRIYGNDIRMQSWYEAYVSLWQYGIIDSETVSLGVTIYKLNYKIPFILQARVRDCTDYYDSKLLVTRENIPDFLSHQITILTQQALSILSVPTSDLEQSFFGNKYNEQILDWDENIIKEYFQDLIQLLEETQLIHKNKISKAQYREVLHLYSEFFVALYRNRENITPGINEFAVNFSGKELQTEQLNFCAAYDKLHLFLKELSPEWQSKEDLIVEKQVRQYKVGYAEFFNEIIPLMSAGEFKLISIVGNIAAEVKDYAIKQPLFSYRKKKVCIILVDEIEKEMHLEWSRCLLNNLIRYFEEKPFIDLWNQKMTLQELNVGVQLIYSTHSPFMLSDLYGNSVIELNKIGGRVNVRQGERIFAQNIQRIISNDFFMDACFGAYAETQVNKVIEWLREESPSSYTEDQSREYLAIIEEIGEPIIRNKLRKMYEEKTCKFSF